MGFSGHNLSCIRGERLVFQDLSFSVAPGKALLLRGPNGSGKSTLLRLAAGFLKPDSGHLGYTLNPSDRSPSLGAWNKTDWFELTLAE